MKLLYIVKKEDNYINLRQLLKEEFKISARLLLKVKTQGKILLNNSVAVSMKMEIKPDDVIELIADFEEENSNVVPTKMDLNIIYEDPHYLVLNKGPNIAIHPSHLHYETSLSNGVRYYFDQIGLKKKIRPVNRLDRDTSRYCNIC